MMGEEMDLSKLDTKEAIKPSDFIRGGVLS